MVDSISITLDTVTDTSIIIDYRCVIASGNNGTVYFYLNGANVGNVILSSSGVFGGSYGYTNLSINTSYMINASLNTDVTETNSNTLNQTTTCFMKNTKILCENLQYKNIEDLNVNDFVFTTVGYKKIKGIQKFKFFVNDDNNLHKIYKLSKDKDDKLIDDLYITGGHSILVDYLSDDEIFNTKKYFNNTTPQIDNKFKLLACIDERFEHVVFDEPIELFHILLENNDINQQFAIFANGILTETIDELHFKFNNHL